MSPFLVSITLQPPTTDGKEIATEWRVLPGGRVEAHCDAKTQSAQQGRGNTSIASHFRSFLRPGNLNLQIVRLFRINTNRDYRGTKIIRFHSGRFVLWSMKYLPGSSKSVTRPLRPRCWSLIGTEATDLKRFRPRRFNPKANVSCKNENKPMVWHFVLTENVKQLERARERERENRHGGRCQASGKPI